MFNVIFLFANARTEFVRLFFCMTLCHYISLNCSFYSFKQSKHHFTLFSKNSLLNEYNFTPVINKNSRFPPLLHIPLHSSSFSSSSVLTSILSFLFNCTVEHIHACLHSKRKKKSLQLK